MDPRSSSPGHAPRRLVAVTAALLASGLGCGGGSAPEATGAVQVFVAVRPGTGAGAAHVHLTGQTSAGRPYDAWFVAPRSDDGFAATVLMPTGRYAVDARAFASSGADPAGATPDFALEAPAPLDVPGSGALAALVLDPPADAAQQALVVPSCWKNSPPRVTCVTAYPTSVDSADPSAVVKLAGAATDPDRNALTYSWKAAYSPALPAGAAPGVFSKPGAATTTWAPPPYYAGTVTFTFTATDTFGATGAMSACVAVKPSNAPGNVAFNVTVNNFPDVQQLTVSDGQLAPGGRSALEVRAVDPDGDPLSYSWSDGGCGGSFLAGASSTATWIAPAAPGTCRLAVTVRDLVKCASPSSPRGGATVSSVSVRVGEPVAAFAPSFGTCASSTPGPVAPGTTVRFYVSAEEAVGMPPVSVSVTQFSWDDATGRAAAFVPVAPPATDAVEWTAPPCGAAVAPLDVVVTATAIGTNVDPGTQQPLSTRFPFPALRVLCP